MGNYSPDIDYRYISTVTDGLSPLGETVITVSGCDNTFCEKYESRDIIQAVKDADIVFLCLGTGKLRVSFHKIF